MFFTKTSLSLAVRPLSILYLSWVSESSSHYRSLSIVDNISSALSKWQRFSVRLFSSCPFDSKAADYSINFGVTFMWFVLSCMLTVRIKSCYCMYGPLCDYHGQYAMWRFKMFYSRYWPFMFCGISITDFSCVWAGPDTFCFVLNKQNSYRANKQNSLQKSRIFLAHSGIEQ